MAGDSSVQSQRANDLSSYAPHVLAWWSQNGPDRRYVTLDGSLLFTDLSGFTALSERLSQRGKVGAELMANAVTAIFTELLEVAADHGGDMLKFGGDALLLLFSGGGHARRAFRAAYEMQLKLRRASADAGLGSARVRMSSGLHAGVVHLFLVGETHRELVAAGPAATIACAMEAAAGPGEVLLSPAAASALGKEHARRAKGQGFLLERPPRVTTAGKVSLPVRDFDASVFLPAAIRTHLTLGGHEPEHRLVTVAFAQLIGVDHDLRNDRQDVVADRLEAAISAAQRCFDRHGVSFIATDVATDGLKILAATGAPTTLGDDADRMLLAMCDLVKEDHPLRVRVGVNRGRAFVGDVGPPTRRTYTLISDATNTAARVMARAAPGQLLATPSVLDAAATAFEMREVPPFVVKGKREPLRAYLVAQPVAARRTMLAEGAAPLVGRDAELERLRSALVRANEGAGTEVQIVAEPGLGKSRLVAALLGAARDTPVAAAVCGPYSKATPYFSLRELLRAGLDSPTGALAKARDLVRQRRPDLERWLPLLGRVMDEPVNSTPEVDALADEFVASRLHELIVNLLDLALPHAVIVIEDVHWLDAASVEALAALSAATRERGWLLLTTRRPGGGGYEAGEEATVALTSLDERSLGTLARQSGARRLLPSDIASLAARSGGNPLFFLELVRAAGDTDVDVLPDSVESLLAARIDGLEPSARTLLRHASVLGLRFDDALLREVLSGLVPLDRVEWGALNDFLERDGGLWAFRHALLRDAAYEGLAFARRTELHERAARAYEQRGGPIELTAIHYGRAQRPNDAWRCARAAAKASIAKLAHAEAIDFYRLAVAAAEDGAAVDAEELATVCEALGDAYDVAGRYELARAAYERARQLQPSRRELFRKQGNLCERSGRYSDALRWYRRGMHDAEDLEQLRLSLAYAGVRLRQGRYRDAVRWAEPALLDADRLGHDECLAQATYLLHLALTFSGDDRRAAHRTRAVSIFERSGDLHGLGKALNNLGVDAYYEGDWAAALDYWARSRDAMVRVGDEFNAATLASNLGEILCDQGRHDAAEDAFTEAAEVADAIGSPLLAAVARKNLARVASRSGRLEEARTLLADARERFRALGARAFLVETDILLAECTAAEGQADDARQALLGLVGAAHAVPWLEAFAYRLLGQAAAALGDVEQARVDLERSVKIASAASARYELILSQLAIAELTGDADLREEAHAALGRMGVGVPARTS